MPTHGLDHATALGHVADEFSLPRVDHAHAAGERCRRAEFVDNVRCEAAKRT